MRNVTGEQLAQVDNPDPFASPVWRSPVYRTPESVIWLVQLLRLLARVIWFAVRHPLADAVAGLMVFIWLRAGWPGLAGLAGGVLTALVLLRLIWPAWFVRLVSGPARNRWRWWFYRRHWHAVMTIARLAPLYRGRVVVPLLGKVTVSGCTDRVAVRLVSGQSPADFAARAEGLAHGFRACLCRARSSAPGAVVLELVRRDALADARAPDPRRNGPAGAAGRTARGRHAVRHTAPGNPPAHRGRPGRGRARTCGAWSGRWCP